MRKWWWSILAVAVAAQEDGLQGQAFLDGIWSIIGADPNVPRDEVFVKPFTGSFTTIQQDEPLPEDLAYCMTDNACGHWDAYSRPDVPLEDLACNSFCTISPSSHTYVQSSVYTIQNPPPYYLNCGWETCN